MDGTLASIIRYPLKKVERRNLCIWPLQERRRTTCYRIGIWEDRVRNLFAAKMEKTCLNLILDSGAVTTCYTSLRVVFLAVLNGRRKPSRIAGMQLPIIHHTLNTKVHSGVGLSESSLTRLWLSAKASQRTPLDETTCASPTPKYPLNMPRFLSLKYPSTS